MPTSTKKVFLSSTLIDLKEYRAAAVHACQRVGLLPIFMEDFPPDSRDAVTFCRAKVDEADLFLGVYAHRYGYVPDGSDISITEMEYDRAVERRLPIHLFVIDRGYPWPPLEVDKGQDYERLERFKAKIGKRHVWKTFGEVTSFQLDVLHHLHEVKREEAQLLSPVIEEGRVTKHTRASPPEMHSVPPYILTNRFIGRRQELDELDAWARSAAPMLVVEAIGGMGKSALTWEWTRERARRSIQGLAGILWWSFYESGASTAAFIREALSYVTGEDPETLRTTPVEDQERRLLIELRQRPFLLVLDGFERLLTAYHHHDPSKLQDDQIKSDLRACTSAQTENLLLQLAICAPSKILVTTRLMPSALENRAHQLIQGVEHRELRGLTPEDGEELIGALGVYGDSGAIRSFLQQFDNHSLLIGVLAGRILDYRPAPGNFDLWLADLQAGGRLRLSDLDLKQRRTNILAYAFEGLKPLRRQLLSRIAILSNAADFATIEDLSPYLPPRPKAVPYQQQSHQQALRAYFQSPEYRAAVSALDAALKDLEDRGLLQWDRTSNTYDLHPVVRGYAFDQLEAPDRQKAYERIRNHFEKLPPENPEEVTDLSGLKNTIQTYRALIGAGNLDKAAELYMSRLASTLLYSIAAYSTVVELLAPLFEGRGFVRLPALRSPNYQSAVLCDLGLALDALGRGEEAHNIRAMELRLDLDAKDWENVAITLDNYSSGLAMLNRLSDSARFKALSWELSRAAGDRESMAAYYLDDIGARVTRGQWEKAEAAYKKSAGCPTPRRTIYRVGSAEASLCWLKFHRGALRQTDLDEALAIAVEAKNPSAQQSLHRLRAELALCGSDPMTASQAAERALAIARGGGTWDREAQGSLARALVLQGRHHEALSLIEETTVPLIDAAEVYCQVGDHEKAKELALRAYQWSWADGPPDIRWWELERSKRLLGRLGVPEPKLRRTDSSQVKTIPFEEEIREAIQELRGKKRTVRTKARGASSS